MALVNTVRSKEAQGQLRRGSVEVCWLDIEDGDRRRAELLEMAIRRPNRALEHTDPGFREANRLRRLEYYELYAGEGLDPASNELTTLLACAVVRGLGLGPRVSFLDLGSARGGLTLVAASVCRKAAGVELSRTSHAQALEALRHFQAYFPNADVDFRRGDLREFDGFGAFDCIYCGIRGSKSRQRVLADLITALLASSDFTQPVRFFCAGFGVDAAGTSFEANVQLTKAYCIRRHNRPAGTPVAEPLYGDKAGPRVILEYRISPDGASPPR